MSWIAWNYLALVVCVLTLALPGSRLRRIAYVMSIWAASLLVIVGASQTLIAGTTVTSPSALLAILPAFTFSLDPVRALFLVVTAAVFALSISFVVQDTTRLSEPCKRSLLLLTAVLYGAMVALLISGAVVSFIFAWEVMSLALWGLVTFRSRDRRSARAGFMTLALSEGGALAALAGLLVLAAASGTFSLAGIAAAASTLPHGVVWSGFLLTFFGFGVKTGVVPVNAWMSEGYAAAPRSLTPIFSGATLNMGVFALWRIDGPLAAHALWPALVVLVTGAVTALVGIVYALASQSMTRLLTHSSIENLGIVVAALGAGFAFQALGHPMLAGLALIAGLFHMINHSAFKTLLFLGAGAVGAAVGTDDLDALGGIMKRVPLFATLFLFGAFAIAALPPFNGFVSEWLTLESLLRVVEISDVPVRITFALSGALLALTAGLALTCFVMLAGSSLMGLPRSRQVAEIKRMPVSATAPMALLTLLCLGLGVLATGVIPVLGRLAASLTGADATPALVPAFFSHNHQLTRSIVTDLTHIGAQIGRGLLPLRGLVVLHSGGSRTPVVFAMSTGLSFAVLLTLLLVVWGVSRWLRRSRRRVVRRELWDAGLVRLQPEMTYTATAFAAPVRVLFDRLLKPLVAEQAQHHGAFVVALHRQSKIVPVVDRFTLAPLIGGAQILASMLARIHRGRVTLYAAYILLSLVVVLLIYAGILR